MPEELAKPFKDQFDRTNARMFPTTVVATIALQLLAGR